MKCHGLHIFLFLILLSPAAASPEQCPDDPTLQTLEEIPCAAQVTSETFLLGVSGNNGNVDKTPDLAGYDDGTTVLLKATPYTGYHFDQWFGNVPASHETDNPLLLTMDDHKTLIARFAITTYSLVVIDDGGSVAIDPNLPNFAFGTSVKVTATPDEGNFFAGWSGTVPEGKEADNPLVLTMNSDVILLANFLGNPFGSHAVTIHAENGWVQKIPNLPAYPDKTLLELRATSLAGYHFHHWEGNVPTGKEFDNPLLLHVENNLMLTAVFEEGTEVFFNRHDIDTELDGAYAVWSGDIDGDGDLDILGVGYSNSTIAWWNNLDGDGARWEKFIIDDTFTGVASITVADINADGHLDVITCASIDHDLTWWENDNGEGTSWIRHDVSTSFAGARDAYAADIDGDGDLDIVGAAIRANDIAWWENLDGFGLAWYRHNIDGGFTDTRSVRIVDLDSDGDMDLLAAAWGDDDVAWWENKGKAIGLVWEKQIIDSHFDGASGVTSADIDGDGDMDVIGAAQLDNDIVWWENTEGDGFAWTKHIVDGYFAGARAVYAADIDLDGDQDIVAAAMDANDITWWENFDSIGLDWIEHTIEGEFDGARDVHVVDIDLDGDFDVLGTAFDDSDLVWWENRTFRPKAPLQAYNPYPADQATTRSILSVMSWDDGGGSTSFDIYFGTKNPPPLISRITNIKGRRTRFNPFGLEYDQTYYWRIDSRNIEGVTYGQTWSFKTEVVPLMPPSRPEFRPILHIEAKVPSVVPGGGSVTYHYEWSSSSGEYVLHADRTETEDQVREILDGVTFDEGESWKVKITPYNENGMAGPTFEGRFGINRGGTVTFSGWKLY